MAVVDEKRVLSSDDVAQLGTIVGIWAHPDDESFLSAGLMALAVENGQKVACVTATKGEAGVRDESKWPAERLAEIRASELMEALKILGVQHHHWLGYTDGTCHEVPDDEAMSKLMPIIERYEPDTIVTFGPDGSTGHLDHRAVSRWSRQAIAKSGRNIRLLYAVDTQEMYDKHLKSLDEKFNIYFNIDSPTLVKQADCDVCCKLPESIARKKVLALKAMTSQTEGMFNEVGEQAFVDIVTYEGFVWSDRSDIGWK